MIDDDRELQREVTHAALQAVEQHGFALAGSGAIREHGIVDRPTRDVDLFTNDMDPAVFETAVDHLTNVLTEAGYSVEEVRPSKQFAHLNAASNGGRAVDIDLAIDWRAWEAESLDVGPVLSVEDACTTKVSALYTRMEARDFVDVEAIRDSGRFTDSDLLRLVAERDAGFDREMFADQLRQIQRSPDGRFTEYDIERESSCPYATREAAHRTAVPKSSS